MSLGVHGLHASDGDQEKRKATREGLKEETRGEKMKKRGFMSLGVHGLHASDGDQEKRKATREGLKEKMT